MMIQAASKWDIEIHVLDPDENCSCSALCHQFHHGSFKNYNDVLEFGRNVDLLTFEIEHINIETLKVLEKDGIKTYPQPEALEIIQDKGLQKQFYDKHNIPTSIFICLKQKEVINAIQNNIIHYPFIQKSRKDGYDGKGVIFIKNDQSLDRLIDVPSMVEEFIEIEKEIAVIVSRNKNGETKTFPTVEMEFSPEANLVEQLICPSEIPIDLDQMAKELAITIINNLNMVGNLAVEFFISKNGQY